jgi:hypothetical protein
MSMARTYRKSGFSEGVVKEHDDQTWGRGFKGAATL